MALDRKLTGTVSRIKVFTGPVQRNKRKMENPRRDMVSDRGGDQGQEGGGPRPPRPDEKD